jgi:hypothetical protein
MCFGYLVFLCLLHVRLSCWPTTEYQCHVIYKNKQRKDKAVKFQVSVFFLVSLWPIVGKIWKLSIGFQWAVFMEELPVGKENH